MYALMESNSLIQWLDRKSYNPTQRLFEIGISWGNWASLGLSLDMIGLSSSLMALNSTADFELTVDAPDMRRKKYSSG